MLLRISSKSIAAIRAHAAETPDVEVCGLLFGTVEAVERVQRCANVADTPATRFEIDPAALIAAHKAERAGGAKLIGHYHSHPNGVCAPSSCDQAAADAVAKLWIIATQDEIAAFMLARDHAPRSVSLKIH